MAFDDEAWQLARALSGAPMVFREEASWLVANPFDPPARVLARRAAHVGGGGSSELWSWRPRRRRCHSIRTAATLLDACSATCSPPESPRRACASSSRASEIERERMRLAAEIHDGLAQDLALAMRELALLDCRSRRPSSRGPSAERLREAVSSAHRVVRARLEDLSVSVPLGGIQAAVEDVCARARAGAATCRTLSTGPAAGPPARDDRGRGPGAHRGARATSARHAGATKVEVRLHVEGNRLALAIEDDGAGFSVGRRRAAPGTATSASR